MRARGAALRPQVVLELGPDPERRHIPLRPGRGAPRVREADPRGVARREGREGPGVSGSGSYEVGAVGLVAAPADDRQVDVGVETVARAERAAVQADAGGERAPVGDLHAALAG